MKRAYTVAKCGLVAEVFCDGRIALVSKVHPGFKIARMIGARGELPNKFVIIPWQDGWLNELLQQKSVQDYCAIRVIPVVAISEPEPLVINIPTSPVKTKSRQPRYRSWGITPTADSFTPSSSAKTEREDFPDESRESESPYSESQGILDDIIGSLRACCTYDNEDDLHNEAQRIYLARSSR